MQAGPCAGEVALFDRFEECTSVGTRVTRRTLAWPAGALALAVVAAGCSVSGSGSAAETTPTEKVTRDDIVVSVGGVGRIVQAKATGRTIETTASGSTSGGSTPAPANAVFSQASGNIVRYLVRPGARVRLHQPLLRINDGGVSQAAVKQAQDDVSTARLELAQLRASHPADLSAAELDVRRAQADLETLRGGVPAARARAIQTARRNVLLSQQRLDRVLGPPRPGDLRAAEVELTKAVADLAALKKPAPAPSAQAVAAAQQAVTAATQKLTKLTGPPDPVAVTAAQLEVKQAEANLVVLQARVDPPTQPELDAANAAITAARAKLSQVQAPPNAADVAAADADVKKAQADLEALTRVPAPPSPEALAAAQKSVDAANQKLAKLHGRPSGSDVTAARLELARARGDLLALQAGPSAAATAAAEQAVRSARARLAQVSSSPIAIASLKVRTALARQAAARFALRLLTVRSPLNGTVTSLLSAAGAPVDRSTPVATVADLDSLAVSVDLSEFDVAQVKLGQRATVSVDALGGRSFPGKVTFVALTGSETSGVVTFPVRIAITRSGAVKSGMNVSVRIIVAQRSDALLVPLDAVTRDDSGGAFVTLAGKDGNEKKVPVTLGLANNEAVQIVKGVDEGQSVVLTAPAAAGADEG